MATARQRQHDRPLKASNATRQTTLVEHGRVARSFWARGRGLLGTRELPAGDGLLIERCSSIHSFWMQYPFDALFLDRDGRVVHMVENMKPNRLSKHVFAARSVLELPAGTIAATDTQRGDTIVWSEEA